MVQMSAGRAIVETLERFGIERVYGIPGYHILDIYDALGTTDITHVMGKNEAEVVRMAGGDARVSDETAVAIVSAGPGSINGMAGIAEANAASLPIVVVAGAEPQRDGGHCIDDPDAFPTMFDEIAKELLYVDDPRDAAGAVAEAFRIAPQGRPGPVVVQSPIDTLKTAAEVTIPASPPDVPPLIATDDAIGAIVDLIDAADRPAILVGQGGERARIAEAVDRLAVSVDAPVAVTTRGLGGYVAPPRYAGIYGGNSSHIPAERVLDRADVLIGVGVREADRRGLVSSFDGEKSYLLERIERYHLGVASAVGDLEETLTAVTESCAPVERDWWRDPVETGWNDETTVIRERIGRDSGDHEFLPTGGADPASLINGEAIHPGRVMLALNDHLDPDAIVTEDVGIHAVYAQKYVDLETPNSFLVSSDLGAMGYTLPSAIGAKFAAPDRQVVGIVGDGSIMMNLAEFTTAVEHDLDVTFLLLNNHQHNAIFKDQTDQYDRGGFTALPGLDFAAFAENAGGVGVTVQTEEALDGGIERALAIDAPVIVEILTRPNITFEDYLNPPDA